MPNRQISHLNNKQFPNKANYPGKPEKGDGGAPTKAKKPQPKPAPTNSNLNKATAKRKGVDIVYLDHK